jgi:predicted ester cyclase
MKAIPFILLSFYARHTLASYINSHGCADPDSAAGLDIKAKYLNYIDVLNSDMPPGSLDPFIKDGVVFNDFAPLSPAECIENVKSVRQLLPNLHFEITWMILEKDMGIRGNLDDGNLAVRANITYQPEPGKEVAFYEHCFYHFEDGKIAFSKSVVDVYDLPEKDQAVARNL